MTKHLVIVESPAKAKTIKQFLGQAYETHASFGHIRDLPTEQMGVNVNEEYQPKYIVPKEKKKVVQELKKKAKQATEVILATDEDREGEAIAWHLAQVLELPEEKIKRIVFHEITERAIKGAMATPRLINSDLVAAQQARRILDRLVGYSLSPFLWKKIRKGLSAGRVQSVAVRLIVEREEEIKKFVPIEYWSITANLSQKEKQDIFSAELDKHNDQKITIQHEKQAHELVQSIKTVPFVVDSITHKEIKRSPLPPFTTSTLQQEASKKLGFSAKKTMLLAQQLYEGVELGPLGSLGLITYMRTDSYHLAESAIHDIRQYLVDTLGKEYIPARPLHYKTKKKAVQEAHEAIRPTDCNKTPKSLAVYLNQAQLQLYELIWQRTLACQMAPLRLHSTSVIITAGSYSFRTSGSDVLFDGFTRIYQESSENNQEGEKKDQKLAKLPALQQGETLTLHDLVPEQHFTKPPAPYTEATLVKALEEYGIGRPSTYAPIMSNIVDRGYVTLSHKKFAPLEIGVIVNSLLVQHFPEIVDIHFTARMEDDLDKIAAGELNWIKTLDEFYKPFFALIQTKNQEVKKSDFYEETKQLCEKCGKALVVKFGKYGKFLACSGFPDCKNTKPLETELETSEQPKNMVCSVCGKPMQLRQGKYGKFWGCTNYPQCKHIQPLHQQKQLGIRCPKCGKTIVQKKTRRGKIFYGCSNYPACDYASWDEPVDEVCSVCGDLKVKNRKGKILCMTCEG